MNPAEPKPDASGLEQPSEARRLADAVGPGELRQLLLKFDSVIGHTFSQVHVAFIHYKPGGSEEASAEWRHTTTALLHKALTQYHALDQRLLQLPLAAFNGRPELRAELLSSLSLIERGLIELSAAINGLGTQAADAKLAQAAAAVRSGHALGLRVSKALGLPT